MSGYVYIAQNELFPHLLKIGHAVNVEKRIKALNTSSSVPSNFKCLYYFKVEDYIKLERKFHSDFAHCRFAPNKEFFKIDEQSAKDFLEKESKKVEYTKSQNYSIQPSRRSVLNFRPLPAVISRGELGRLSGKNDTELKVSVNNWVKTGILKKAGPRSGIYYNLVNDPNWEDHIAEAVFKKYPSAIVAGPTVLHQFGCQTQDPGKRHFIILSSRTNVDMDGVELMARPLRWYEKNKPEQQLFGLPSLSPKQALKDGLDHSKNPGSWVPNLADINLDVVNSSSFQPNPLPRRKIF